MSASAAQGHHAMTPTGPGALHTYVVAGRGDFPLDAMQQDGSRPLSPKWQEAMAAGSAYRTVKLTGARTPDLAAWAAFGWRVITIDDRELAEGRADGHRPETAPPGFGDQLTELVELARQQGRDDAAGLPPSTDNARRMRDLRAWLMHYAESCRRR